MRLRPNSRYMCLSIALAVLCAAVAVSSEVRFHPGPAASYAHQESEKVTVGAKCFDNEDLVTSAFGKKIDFAKYGVVPVLVVIENKRDQALDLQGLEATLVAADGRHARAIRAEDLPFLATAGRHPPSNAPRSPIPIPKRKNPLNATEISMRALEAKVIAPGDSASGFLYFEAKEEPGDKLYLNGMRDARSGNELLYFEFPLGK